MNTQGVALWLARNIGDLLQVWGPVLAFFAALFWCRTEEKPLCYFALLGAVIASIGRLAQLLLPNVSWVALSRIEHIPSGSTTFIEAIAFLTFTHIGMGLFMISVTIHFIRISPGKTRSQ